MSKETLKPKPIYLDATTHGIVIEGLAIVNVKRVRLRIQPLKLGEYINRILREYHREGNESTRVA